jgi:hypothetical protein
VAGAVVLGCVLATAEATVDFLAVLRAWTAA